MPMRIALIEPPKMMAIVMPAAPTWLSAFMHVRLEFVIVQRRPDAQDETAADVWTQEAVVPDVTEHIFVLTVFVV
jgi:hypothetical protein